MKIYEQAPSTEEIPTAKEARIKSSYLMHDDEKFLKDIRRIAEAINMDIAFGNKESKVAGHDDRRITFFLQSLGYDVVHCVYPDTSYYHIKWEK